MDYKLVLKNIDLALKSFIKKHFIKIYVADILISLFLQFYVMLILFGVINYPEWFFKLLFLVLILGIFDLYIRKTTSDRKYEIISIINFFIHLVFCLILLFKIIFHN